ncbi:MAG TPA: hypothetical protein VHS78_13340 [Candidatus Elarobacter sp.]|jgi:hypothetical protein|nr:hypothetical protein [Candidatus Elarobacter sp.]
MPRLTSTIIVSAACAALAACAGAGPQTTPPAGTANAAGAPHGASAYRGERTTSASARTTMSTNAVTCTPVVTAAHGPLTAAVVATSTIDHATVDATGCDIGIYVGPSSNGQKVDHTAVHDATQYGFYVDQAQNLTIDHTQVYKIGVHDGSGNFAPNGVQWGVGIYFSGASGSIDHTDIYQYQKNGTAFNCLWDATTGACAKPSSVSVQHSTATGLGPVNYIAQNGFQYWDSTAPTFQQNTSSNNSYDNPQDPVYNHQATGYLFLCTNVSSAQQLQKQHNTATNDDIPFYVDNNPADC